MLKTLHIGIVVDRSWEYGRGITRGIVSYARPSKSWVFHFLGGREEEFTGSFDRKQLHGIIGSLSEGTPNEQYVQMGLPCVNISNQRPIPGIPRIGNDEEGIGRVAARHFLDRGFENFAFVGSNALAFSRGREAGYRDELSRAGFKHHSYVDMQRAHFVSDKDRTGAMQRWLESLPRPIAVFITSDVMAWNTMEVIRAAGISVPESIAVVSVDNDEMLCTLTSPPLSSIAVPTERIGFEAASILDSMLDGKHVSLNPILFPPKEVVTRQSSDVVAIGDPELASAVRFIRNHAGERIGVRDVVRATKVARRSLERKFRIVLGRSPLEEIRRARLERVRELLANTDLAMPEVAAQSGFDSAVRLTTVFRSETGMTPTAFRRQYRMVTGGVEGSGGAPDEEGVLA